MGMDCDQLRPLAADASGTLVDTRHKLALLLLYMRGTRALCAHFARGSAHAHTDTDTDTHGHRKM
jgi:hypothetical protein